MYNKILSIGLLFLACHESIPSDPCSINNADNATFNGDVLCFDDHNVKTTFPANAYTFLLDTFMVIYIESLDSNNQFNFTDTVSHKCTIWEGWVTHLLNPIDGSGRRGSLEGDIRLVYPLPFLPCPGSYFDGVKE